MPEVNVSATVPAAPDKAWEAISNPNRFADWLTIHDGWGTEPPAELAVGTTFQERVKLMGMVNKIDWTVDALAVPSSVKISGKGLAGVKVSFTMSIEPADQGSKVSIDAEFSGQMVIGALGAAVTKDAKKNLEESLAKLSTVVS